MVTFFICRSRNVRKENETRKRIVALVHVKCMLIWKQDQMKSEPILDPTKKNEAEKRKTSTMGLLHRLRNNNKNSIIANTDLETRSYHKGYHTHCILSFHSYMSCTCNVGMMLGVNGGPGSIHHDTRCCASTYSFICSSKKASKKQV